jgi:hypothetical protein
LEETDCSLAIKAKERKVTKGWERIKKRPQMVNNKKTDTKKTRRQTKRENREEREPKTQRDH